MGKIIVMPKLLLLLCFFFFFLGCSDQLLLSSSSSFSNSSTKLCPHGEALALLQFKQSFSIDHNSSSSCYGASYPKTEKWKDEGSEDCCSWDGVTCDLVTGHVIELDLSCSWLSGTIHPNSTLFLFSHHLQSLNLAFNDFYMSSVSAGFGRFSSLTYLNLSGSQFSGLISPEISHLSNLVSLDLSWNDRAEFAPHGLDSLVQNLTKLQKLHLSGISISSVFPNSLLNRSSLISLDLSQCGLHGRFPDHHDIHLPKLQLLSLRGNYDLSGNFPRFSENNSLIHLDLSMTNFSGEILDSMSNLKSLQTLDLSNCQFSGSIPASLGNLKSLQTLYLYECQLSGSIPASLGNLKSLKTLDLSNCQFSGSIPASLGNLKSLQTLVLSNCQFSGSIPASLQNLTQITSLDLFSNHFSGKIPNVFDNLRNLINLFLSSNNFSGQIPASIGNLTSLYALGLSDNQLEGAIPSTVNDFSSLSYVDVSYNLLNGTIPSWLYALPSLLGLSLSHNKFTGRIGEFKSDSLQFIDLSMNELQGPLPTPPNSTSFFSVSHNKLSGEISSLICKASSMEILDLSRNNFCGILPHCLGNFSKDLTVLNLRRNQFYGTIPQRFFKRNSIRTLDFNGNQLEGLVPRSLIVCRELEVLDLGNNKINDTFPHWLRALPKLQVLVLHSNHFHGHIGFSKIKSPFMSLRIIDLAHNDFEGDLPEMYLRSLKAIMNIDEGNMTKEYMGNYYYQDSIMMTIKGLEIEFVKILNTLTTIDLSSNKFQGGIPECIGNLNSLRELNLSHNNLTGHIPLSFRNLKMLESLDLSSNELSGRIPEELTSLTFLEVLNLSQNHLIGLIPKGNQFSTFGNDSYYGNSGLCGFPLSKRCININETPGLSEEEDAEFENTFDWIFMLMGYGCGLIFGLSLGGLIFLVGKPRWLVTMVEDNIHKKITRPKRSTYRRVSRRN